MLNLPGKFYLSFMDKAFDGSGKNNAGESMFFLGEIILFYN
jgi:hypothetical protein